MSECNIKCLLFFQLNHNDICNIVICYLFPKALITCQVVPEFDG